MRQIRHILELEKKIDIGIRFIFTLIKSEYIEMNKQIDLPLWIIQKKTSIYYSVLRFPYLRQVKTIRKKNICETYS